MCFIFVFVSIIIGCKFNILAEQLTKSSLSNAVYDMQFRHPQLAEIIQYSAAAK